MKLSTAICSLGLAALGSLVQAASPPAIEIKGNKFFYSGNGTQFYIKGIAYQSDVDNSTSDNSFTDPLADFSSCKRDLPYLLELGTNALRVYAINTSLDHTDCINLFADNGIYIISDLSEPGLSIDRDDPTWTVTLYKRYTAVVDALHNYTNVLGFFAGNEVTNNSTNTDASPFVKAAIRDTKSYIKAQGYRSIPVGYSTNDDADTRSDMANYFVCGNSSVAADFYGINMYEWCGSSSFSSSGYQARTKEFANLGVPLFFSEYGCNTIQPRKFTEVGALYSDEMTDVWSGGIVYMYFEEANNYGLVTVSGSSISTLTDFGYLSSEIAAITPTYATASAYTASSADVTCPASTGSDWKANTNLPPTPNQAVCDCISPASGCVVADDVDEDDYADLFSYLCGEVSCAGITGNGTSGDYGAFSYCSSKDQLNFVLNLYYESQNKADSACSFSGSASVNSDTSTNSVCSSIFKAAGTAGTNSVSASVAAALSGDSEAGSTASSTGSGSGSAASSASSSSSSKKSSAPGAPRPASAYVLISGVMALAAGLGASVFF